MATNTVNETAENPSTAKPAKDAKDGFVKVETRRYMYNMDRCEKVPLQGYLLNMIEMAEMDGRPWQAFVLRTTEVTKGVDRFDEIVDVEVGAEVLIPATYELQQYLQRAALHPAAVYEVKLTPDQKIGLDKRRQMWLFDIQTKPRPFRRSAFGIAGLLGAAAPVRELPQAAANNTSDADFDDIPF